MKREKNGQKKRKNRNNGTYRLCTYIQRRAPRCWVGEGKRITRSDWRWGILSVGIANSQCTVTLRERGQGFEGRDGLLIFNATCLHLFTYGMRIMDTSLTTLIWITLVYGVQSSVPVYTHHCTHVSCNYVPTRPPLLARMPSRSKVPTTLLRHILVHM